MTFVCGGRSHRLKSGAPELPYSAAMQGRVWLDSALISVLSFLYAALIVLRTVISGVDLPGYASLIVAILFLGGIQLIGLGVLGEYIGRIYIDVKRRPHYFIRAVHEP